MLSSQTCHASLIEIMMLKITEKFSWSMYWLCGLFTEEEPPDQCWQLGIDIIEQESLGLIK